MNTNSASTTHPFPFARAAGRACGRLKRKGHSLQKTPTDGATLYLPMALGLVLALSLEPAQGATTKYFIHDLGVTDTGLSYATAINSSGCIVGYDLFTTSWKQTPDGTRVSIPLPTGARYADAYSINDVGQVVGDAAYTDGGWGKAWVWDGGSSCSIIDPLPGYATSQADHISNNGVVVGLSMNEGDWLHATAYKWSLSGGLTRLAPLPGDIGSSANAVNDAGVVVGTSVASTSAHWQACLWSRDGAVRSINPPGAYFSQPSAINEDGYVTLYACFEMSKYHSFLWREDLGYVEMGHLGGGQSACTGLNSKCQAAGWSYDRANRSRAFVWSQQTGMLALPALQDQYSSCSHAIAINDSGVIVGYSRGSDLLMHAVCWQPDTEPVADASATATWLVSANGLNATAVLDGSRSSDADGDALQYSWFSASAQPPTLLATGAVAETVLPVGRNPIDLVVSDGLATSTNTLTISVLTTGQALQELLTLVNGSAVGNPKPLTATLSAALASLDHGNGATAANQLRAFQNKVPTQVAEPDLANHWRAVAQQVIEALER